MRGHGSGLAAAVAVALAVPWRIWFTSRDLTGEAPAAGLFALFDHLDRGWPAFESAISAVLDYDLWLLSVPLVIVAAILAFLAGATGAADVRAHPVRTS